MILIATSKANGTRISRRPIYCIDLLYHTELILMVVSQYPEFTCGFWLEVRYRNYAFSAPKRTRIAVSRRRGIAFLVCSSSIKSWLIPPFRFIALLVPSCFLGLSRFQKMRIMIHFSSETNLFFNNKWSKFLVKNRFYGNKIAVWDSIPETWGFKIDPALN